MNVTILPELGVTRVELEGSIDGKTAPQIREELSAILQLAQKIVIDMSRVDYLSSARLRLLLLLYVKLPLGKAAGRGVARFCSMTRSSRHLVQLIWGTTGLRF